MNQNNAFLHIVGESYLKRVLQYTIENIKADAFKKLLALNVPVALQVNITQDGIMASAFDYNGNAVLELTQAFDAPAPPEGPPSRERGPM